MKKYIRSRIFMVLEAIVLVTVILLFVRKESIKESTFQVVANTSFEGPLDLEIIKDKQQELYKQNEKNPLYTFVGELTGYGGDCPLCSGRLGCPPNINVLKKGIYYNDATYGKVRIVASSKNYPCGTILKFNVKKLSSDPIIAIILDRGVSGNVIDLLTESEEYASKYVGRVRNLKFEVLREGWKKR